MMNMSNVGGVSRHIKQSKDIAVSVISHVRISFLHFALIGIVLH